MTATVHTSVCVPTWNGRAWIDDCLGSLAGQLPDDVEVLVIDDASTDGTPSAVRGWAERLPLRLLVNRDRLGLVGNLNRLVHEARGEWIKFLFQDDRIAPGAMASLLATADSGNRIVIARREYVVEPGVPLMRVTDCRDLVAKSVHARFRGWTRMSPDDVCRVALTTLDRNYFGEPSSWLVHRSCFEDVGGFDDGLVQYLDLEWLLRATTNTGLGLCHDALTYFRVHGDSATARGQLDGETADLVDRAALRVRLARRPAFDRLRRFSQHVVPPFDWDAYAGELVDAVQSRLTTLSADDALARAWQRALEGSPELGEFVRSAAVVRTPRSL